MKKSLLLLSALILSFAQNVLAQCSVTITPSPISVCFGQPFTVTASAGADSYVWYDPMQQVVGTTDIVTIFPPAPGTMIYTVEAQFGTCTATANVTVSVTSLPVTAGSNAPVLGGALNLTANTIPGATYQWAGPNSFASSMQNPTINAAQCINAGTYTLSVTANGCTATDTVTVNISGMTPVIGTNNGPVCAGDVLQLSATTITGATYQWTGPNGFTSTLEDPSFIVNGAADGGIYTVQANDNGCISTDTTFVMICNTILVTNYIDDNTNCIFETGIDNILVQTVETEIDSNGVIIDTISSIGGFYYMPNGSVGDVYTFKVVSVPTGMSTACPVTGIVSHTLTTAGLTNIDMGFLCNNFNDYDLGLYASNPASTATWQIGHILLTNDFCNGINSTVTLTHSPKYQYQAATPIPTSIAGNTITWNIGNLTNGYYPFAIYYNLSFSTAPVSAGDTTHSYFTISPTTGDIDISNNTYFHIDTVVASMDPNAITAFPSECVSAGTKMQYTIQFENVGNAPAENIYVLDTIPAELEFNTMKLLMSSHNMFVTKIQDGGYNILRFDFPDINLPDSSDHAGCHGQLVYTIDLDGSLPYGAEIYHKAGIYFDYNAVVMTNNERTTICIPQNVTTTSKNGSTMLYPNPAGDELTLQTDGTYSNCTITNNVGQMVAQQQLNGKQTIIDVHSLAPGIYYVNIHGAANNEVLRFVKK